jgi:hypothetical protein
VAAGHPGHDGRLDAAAANGARVVIALYYNPYNDQKDAGPFGLFSRDCSNHVVDLERSSSGT